MTNLIAAVAGVQLRRLPGVVARRRRLAARLLAAVGDLPGVHLPADPELHAWWVLPLVVDGGNRRWADALTAEGVPAHGGWLQSPVYLYPALTERLTYGKSAFPLTSPPARIEWTYGPGLCPEAERLVDDTLVVLQWNENYTDADVDDIAAALTKVAGADPR